MTINVATTKLGIHILRLLKRTCPKNNRQLAKELGERTDDVIQALIPLRNDGYIKSDTTGRHHLTNTGLEFLED